MSCYPDKTAKNINYEFVSNCSFNHTCLSGYVQYQASGYQLVKGDMIHSISSNVTNISEAYNIDELC